MQGVRLPTAYSVSYRHSAFASLTARLIVALAQAVLHETEVIGTGGRILVTDLAEHAVTVDEKYTRQLAPVWTLQSRAAAKRGPQPASPYARMRELEQRPFPEIESTIERVIRIAEARHVTHPVPLEPLGRLIGGLHVHERYLRSLRAQRET
jgi:hypothetical protein